MADTAELERAKCRARDAIFDWSRPQLRGYTIGMLMASPLTPANLVADYQAACDALGKGWY